MATEVEELEKEATKERKFKRGERWKTIRFHERRRSFPRRRGLVLPSRD